MERVQWRLFVMFRMTRRHRESTHELLSTWLPTLTEIVPHWDTTTFDACEDLVTTITEGDGRALEAALTRFGRQLGEHGWLLREIAAWVDGLAEVAGSHGPRLTHFSAGLALAQGWAEGSQHGTQVASCIDPITGLATLAVMHLRLAQVYDQSAALGVNASELYSLIVIDTQMEQMHPFERDAVRAVAAELIAVAFKNGETIAHHDGRMLVLTSSHGQIRERMLDLLVAFDASPLLDNCTPVCWIEQLPTSRAQLDRYLFELTPSTL